MKLGDIEKLIYRYPLSDESTSVCYYVITKQIINIIHKILLGISHAERTRILNELQNKYGDITQEQLKIYSTLCETSQKKSKVQKIKKNL